MITPQEAVQRNNLPINPDCPAMYAHNTCSAAQGVYRVKKKAFRQPACICPHAIKLFDDFRAKRRETYGAEKLQAYQRRQARNKQAPEARKGAPIDGHTTPRHLRAAPKPPKVPWPDLSGGACRSARGVMTMDAYADFPNTHSSVANARELCDSCPVHEACERWIQQAEQPAGSWHGMFAGRTPRERELAAGSAARGASA